MNIIEQIKAIEHEQLDAWTDIRMVGRGYGIVDNVSRIVAAEDCVSARVRGGSLYVTSVFVDAQGKVDSRCTCPVRTRCKHAVALMLAVQRKLKAGEAIPLTTIPAESDARLLVQAAEEAERRAEEAKRLAALQEEKRRAAARRAEIKRLKADFEQARERVLMACAHRDPAAIRDSVEELLYWSDDDLNIDYPEAFHFVPDLVNWTMETVVVALRASGWSAADVLVWACDLTRPYHFFCPGKVIENLWESPAGEYTRPDVWAEAATKLTAELKNVPARALSGEDTWSHLLRSVQTAWRRAGHEERCVPVFVDYVEKAKIWREGVQLLNRFGCYDEAIRMARKGVKAMVEEGELEEIALLMEPLADAFSGKGDYARAAAVRAEQFLEWRGCYGCHMTTDRFYAILADAEKAGLRTEVRAALIHALETGWNPPSIVTFRLDEMEPGEVFRNPPKRIDYFIRTTLPEAPTWPLPWAREGIRLDDTRWDDFLGGCRDDFHFLLRLALVEGNKDEIARRFCDLPSFPGGNEDLLERVKDALRGFRPDIVEVIVLQGRGWKNIWTGKCDPKVLRRLCK